MKRLLAMLALAGVLVAGMAPAAGAATPLSLTVREAVVSKTGATLYITVGGVQHKCAKPTMIQPESSGSGVRTSLTIKCPNGSMTAHIWTDRLTIVMNGRTRSCVNEHIFFGWFTDSAKNITRLYEEWSC